MVKVVAYISDPHGIITETTKNGTMPAPVQALADDAAEATKSMLAAPPQTAGQDFKAGAVREGVYAATGYEGVAAHDARLKSERETR